MAVPFGVMLGVMGDFTSDQHPHETSRRLPS
jgi:hypothetical protein